MRAGAFRGDLKCVLHLGGRMATGNKSFSVQGVEIHLATKGEEERGIDLDAFALLVHDLSDEKHVLIADLAGIAALVGVV